MKTPAGFECRYFYGNYYRGRKDEECRLIHGSPAKDAWNPDVCRTCPVPAVFRANACPNLILEGKIASLPFGLRKRMKITAFCTKANAPVNEPEIGCGQCHPMPDVFKG